MSFNFENLPRDYEQLPVPVYILKGRSTGASSGLVEAVCDKFPPQYYEVTDGYFKAYLHLGDGTNKITLRHIDGGWDNSGYAAPTQGSKVYAETQIVLTYQPLTAAQQFEVPKIHLCVMLGKDSPGTFDCPQQTMYQGNGLETAVKKLRVGGRMMQAFTLDEMAKNGVGKRCFQFVEEVSKSTISKQEEANGVSRSQIKIHVIRSDLTVAQLRDMNYAQQNKNAKEAGKLFGAAMDALKKYGGPFSDGETSKNPVLAAVLLMDAHWSRQDNCILCHAALGGGNDRIKLAIFGSHGIHSWPLNWESIFRSLTDCSTLSLDEVANDCNQCSSRWECLCVTLGAFMHEIGHSLGCPHQENGVMLRDYITMDRKFLSAERYCMRTKKPQWGPVLDKDEPGWNRLDIMRFLFHPAFSLLQDLGDEDFKPPSIYFNQGMKTAKGVDSGPNFVVVNDDTVEIQSETGIYLVECHIGEWSRLHYEYLPLFYNGIGPQKSIRLQLSLLEKQLDPKWQKQKVKLEVLTLGGQRSITFQDFLNNSLGLLTPSGAVVRKGDVFGNNKGKHVQILFPPGRSITQIDVYTGSALDGFKIFFDDNTSVLYGNEKRSHSTFEFAAGEKLQGIGVRSGAWVDGLSFITTTRTSPHFGGNGGSLHKFIAPPGTEVVGFHGSMGGWVNQVGVLYA